MTTTIKGQLEIDVRRGVIYFHDETGQTRLRVCRLKELNVPMIIKHIELIDITHMVGASVTFSAKGD